MEQTTGHYRRLGLMLALSFIAMYALMYAMVDQEAKITEMKDRLGKLAAR